jgi:cytochrome bd ubiquinol oxidase subunit II
MDLNIIWYLLVGGLLTGYAVLDGFDLGTGPLLLFTKRDRDRRIFLNAIGPIWNGNEVWLVTGGGALFAAFPEVYATVFSGFYDAFMLLLFALIFRASAIEFRGQREGTAWRRCWDIAFATSSVVSALLIGITIGNLIRGIPLDAAHEFRGDLPSLLNPYALLVGITAVALMTLHGNLYLVLKTEGPLQQEVIGWTRRTVPAFLVCFIALNLTTVLTCHHLHTMLEHRAILLGGIVLVATGTTFNILLELRRGNEGRAFISSCLVIITMMCLFGATMFPNFVISRPDPTNHLDIYNGASTPKSLNFMVWVALIGMPFVVAYTVSIYYIFRGKVRLTDDSY